MGQKQNDPPANGRVERATCCQNVTRRSRTDKADRGAERDHIYSIEHPCPLDVTTRRRELATRKDLPAEPELSRVRRKVSIYRLPREMYDVTLPAGATPPYGIPANLEVGTNPRTSETHETLPDDGKPWGLIYPRAPCSLTLRRPDAGVLANRVHPTRAKNLPRLGTQDGRAGTQCAEE